MTASGFWLNKTFSIRFLSLTSENESYFFGPEKLEEWLSSNKWQ
jgi:hypothetical protein